MAGRQTVQVNPVAAYEQDLLQFEGLLAEGGIGRNSAVELYRGDFLADFYLPDNAAFEEWARPAAKIATRRSRGSVSPLP